MHGCVRAAEQRAFAPQLLLSVIFIATILQTVKIADNAKEVFAKHDVVLICRTPKKVDVEIL